ncbi:MarR family winged helix-turn-helix transcriptional regulator [Chitinophaga varians]|uniref:MarR family winged helix-turn-helix transcriptional regulator n=1 Tax=Chitinophaga varians TaxID=2202339 RepID=UPI00165EE749|nr:MarR family winged helix-turn-helix transcriptional regulator [Chitinophaga varians]MBC9909463.1 winged helix-turn-helix transcriptional regulator [Chitinophaga varians]
MEKVQKAFFDTYTDFQCYVIAQVNSGDYNGVGATHYNIVEYLYRKGPANSKTLAQKFHISAPAISRHVKLLLEKKLLVQKQLPEDRRNFLLEVTSKGKLLVDGSENQRHSVTTRISGMLPKKELEQFTRILRKVVDILKEE